MENHDWTNWYLSTNRTEVKNRPRSSCRRVLGNLLQNFGPTTAKLVVDCGSSGWGNKRVTLCSKAKKSTVRKAFSMLSWSITHLNITITTIIIAVIITIILIINILTKISYIQQQHHYFNVLLQFKKAAHLNSQCIHKHLPLCKMPYAQDLSQPPGWK